jgi:hypothetical protein
MRRTLLVGIFVAIVGAIGLNAGEPKVTICHVPPGNPSNAHTITIGQSAVPAHLANHPGDSLGPCKACVSCSK